MGSILIIGSGITGITTAYALLEQGHHVTVIDRHRYPAMETSYANGGQLSASNAEVWNGKYTILQGLKWMMRANAPLLMNPKPSWHKYGWLAEFCGQITNHRDNTIRTAQIAIAAREYLIRMATNEGIDFDLETRGILHLYHCKESFERASRANDLLVEGGLTRHAVTPEEIRQIEPTIEGRFYGGFYTPDDFSGDAAKFTRGLAEACRKRGASLLFGHSVERITPHRNGVSLTLRDEETATSYPADADAVVVCAGVASKQIAGSLGDRINIYPVKGYSITVCLEDPESIAAAPRVSLLDEAAKIVTSRLGDDRFRIAGTAEFNGYNRDIRADRVNPLVAWAMRRFPSISTCNIIPWAGLRPMTPNMLPHVRRGRHPRVYYNTGHGHLGWTMSAATAQTVAAALSERSSFRTAMM